MENGTEGRKAKLYQTAWTKWDDNIQLALDEVILSKELVTAAAFHLIDEKNINRRSRRKIPDWIIELLEKLEGRKVFSGDGKELDLHETVVSVAFNNNETYRYLSDFLKYAYAPMRRKPNKKLLLRYQLIVLAAFLDGKPIEIWIRNLFGK